MATDASGNYDASSVLSGNNLGGVLGAILGKDVKTDGSSTQNTTGTTTQAGTTSNTSTQTGNTTNSSTGTTAGTSNQSTTGSTTGATTGVTTGLTTSSQNSGGTSSQSNTNSSSQSGGSSSVGTSKQNTTGSQTADTSGTTTNAGASHVTGGSTTDTSGQVVNNSTTTSNADVSALKAILAKQSAGVTPEMLNAIFEQGARAAPDLIRAHADAVGTRISNNSGVATSLGDLETKLTRQVADLNNTMLAQSASTAGQIADLTKSSTTSGTQSTSQTAKDVQDLLTANNSSTVMQQLAKTISANAMTGSTTDNTSNHSQTSGSSSSNSANSSFNNAVNATIGTTSGTSSGTQAQNVAASNTGTSTNNSTGTSNQTSANAGTSNVTGTQTQAVNATNNSNVTTSINSGALANIMTGAAAGLGALALYKMATSGGFSGGVAAFNQWLKGSGAQVSPTTQHDLDVAAQQDIAGGLDPAWGTNAAYDTGTGISDISDAATNLINSGSNVDFSGNQLEFFADGGLLTSITGIPQARDSNTRRMQRINFNDTTDDNDLGNQHRMFRQNNNGVQQPVDPTVPLSHPRQIQGGFNSALQETLNPAASPMMSVAPSPQSGYQTGIGGSDIPAYADGGGDDFLPIPDLLAKNRKLVINPDADINAMVKNVLGGGGGSTPAPSPAPASAPVGNNSNQDTGSAGGNDGNSGTAGGSTSSGSSSSGSGVSVGSNGISIGGVTVGIGQALGLAMNAISGNLPGLAMNIANIALSNNQSSQTAPEGMDTAIGIANNNNDANTISDADAVSAVSDAAAAEGISGDSSSDGDGTSSGDSAGDGGWADGGSVDTENEATEDPAEDTPEEENHEALLEAMGINRDGNGGLQFNNHAVTILHKALTGGASKPPGYANGRLITGPGTGISDSIPAKGPDGQGIRVSHGEYIMPADTVAHYGVDQLDKMVRDTHVPAELQRAMFGE